MYLNYIAIIIGYHKRKDTIHVRPRHVEHTDVRHTVDIVRRVLHASGFSESSWPCVQSFTKQNQSLTCGTQLQTSTKKESMRSISGK